MGITVLGLLMVGIYFLWRHFTKFDHSYWDFVFCGVGYVGTVILIVSILAIPIFRYDSRIYVEQHKEFKSIIEDDISDNNVQNAMLTKDIINANMALIRKKEASRNFMTKVYHVDEVDNLNPIEINQR